MQLGFLYDALDSGEFTVHYAETANNPANIMTAAEDRVRFARSRAALDGTRAPNAPSP